MADEELRALERRFLATGDPALGERLVQALRRTRAPVVITERALYRSETVHRSELLLGWLRFQSDGLVLSVTTSSPARPDEIARWFTPAHEHSSRGRWRLDGERLSFETESEYGRVDYEGVVVGDELRLRSHSHINDHRAERVYKPVLLTS
jgi:hypothetical protein